MSNIKLSEVLAKINSVTIGPPPWTDEVLAAAYFRSFTKTRDLIRTHPGHTVHRDLEDLDRGLELFHDSIDALKTACHLFKTGAVTNAFWWRANQAEFERRVRAICLALFAAICASQALVDTCRATSKHVVIADYKDHVKDSFSTWGVSRFIHGLRTYISHRRVLEAQWEVQRPAEGPQEVRFLLRREDLLAYGAWPSEAREYIKQYPEGIDPEHLFEMYGTRVDAFHEWYREAFARAAQPALSEYRQYLDLLDRLGSRSNWNLLVDIGVKQGLDPYSYLTQYLTPQELTAVSQLPKRSIEQVDRIIQIVDTRGACDEALRNNIYRLFKVAETDRR
ncbi:MAG: hypothetical protein OEV08_05745 [Nitrospira sp.]|nr:hypothetical protein [Nitrospira sp.]